jgi:hypothetical protein
MTVLLIALVVVLAVALAALFAIHLGIGTPRASRPPAARTRRILFPFVGGALSRRTLDAALRLAIAEDATLVPVFLARVPLNLPVEAPLPRQCETAMPLQEAIEHLATQVGVPVDARIERGRNHRHALRRTIGNERFDRIVIAAAAPGTAGFDADDVAWLLKHAPGEIVVLRPSDDKLLTPSVRRARPRRRRRHAVSREYETAASR